jgi:hypothetical protein
MGQGIRTCVCIHACWFLPKVLTAPRPSLNLEESLTLLVKRPLANIKKKNVRSLGEWFVQFPV